MVKKLFKHEYHFYLRIMAIVYGILLTMSVATRLIASFESDTQAYEIIRTFALTTYYISILAAFGFAFVLGIVRFYKNMFTCEGYLTNTLPVTAAQHIMVKSVTAFSMNLLSAIVVVLSFVIALPFELLAEFFEDFDLFGEILYELGGQNLVQNLTVLYVECIVLMFVGTYTSILFYYTCISIGQLFKKNRILGAVGVYFAFYILGQIVTTITTVSLAFFTESDAFYPVIRWIGENPFAAIHSFMWFGILILALAAVIEFFAVRWIVTKKLNLE